MIWKVKINDALYQKILRENKENLPDSANNLRILSFILYNSIYEYEDMIEITEIDPHHGICQNELGLSQCSYYQGGEYDFLKEKNQGN